MKTDKFGDWLIVTRKTNNPIRRLIGILLQPLFLLPEPSRYSSVTWTVRHAQTGEVRKVTAYSENEVAQRIAAGEFDKL